MYLANEDCREGLEVCLRDWNDLVADYGGGEDGCVAIRLANGDTWYVTKGIQFLQEESLIIRDVFENSNGEGFFMLLDGWSDVVLDRQSIEPKLWFSQYELKRADTETNNIQFEEGCFLRMLGVKDGG